MSPFTPLEYQMSSSGQPGKRVRGWEGERDISKCLYCDGDKQTNTAMIMKLICKTDSMLFEMTPEWKTDKNFMISTGG